MGNFSTHLISKSNKLAEGFLRLLKLQSKNILKTAAISCTIFIFLVGAQISFGISVGLLLFSKYWLFIGDREK